ncbi:hypothetical protein [Pelotomaculum propionicicum]|uniref:hypothetical protein n=1 Tax=Pelotomaculum propionicicum TaxID=258475 RepID=UPI003B9EAEEC
MLQIKTACTSGSLEPSHVLTAMGVPPKEAHGSLRITLGKDTRSFILRQKALKIFIPAHTQ